MTALVAAAVLAALPPPADVGAPADATGPPALSPEDMAAARTAWRYFERNYHRTTGFVSSVEGYPSTTLWDLGSSLFATVAARELGLIEPETFDARVSVMLRTLAVQPLFEGELPNKAYDAATGAMTDYENRPTPRGIGSSAVDLGRLASALEVLACLYPEHRSEVARVLAHWRYCHLLGNGEMHGALVDGAGVRIVQEGRLGYEQYAARALDALGLDVSRALRWDRFAAEATILGVAVPHDARDPRRFGALDAVTTDPWVLGAFEFGGARWNEALLRRVFEVQKRRWQQTGVVTAASEDHVDRAPWFVYDSIYAAGRPWRTVTAGGQDVPGMRGLSTKAAFALATLFPRDPYSRVLLDAIAGARDPERGWFAGAYESGGLNASLNANTNGVVLEALLYKLLGPLHDACAGTATGEAWATDAGLSAPGGACFPGTAAARAAASAGSGDGGPAGRLGEGLAPVPQPTTSLPGPPLPSAPGSPALRLDGTAFAGYRGADGPTTGGVATLWLLGSSFLRIGAEATPRSPGGPVRLLWGLGYDDWHDKTFFLHVDNWGPVRPEEGLAVRRAELNAGYKLPRLCFTGSICAAPVAALTAPFAGGPYLSARINLTLWRDWFLMGGLGWTIPGVLEGPPGTPRWRLVYGLGRWSWRPGSIYVTYYDWGPSWRQGNGILAVGINWAF